MSLQVVFIDNFDSFTFNLVDEFARRGCEVRTFRNSVSVHQVLRQLEKAKGASLLVLSPGPGHPRSAGCCIELIQAISGRFPMFGVCLGHQAMIEAYGGKVGPTGAVMHGKSSFIQHHDLDLFAGLPNPLQVARYHSLAGLEIPNCLEVTARFEQTVMAIRHREFPIFGVQFHPESILTPRGGLLIDNLIKYAGENQS